MNTQNTQNKSFTWVFFNMLWKFLLKNDKKRKFLKIAISYSGLNLKQITWNLVDQNAHMYKLRCREQVKKNFLLPNYLILGKINFCNALFCILQIAFQKNSHFLDFVGKYLEYTFSNALKTNKFRICFQFRF